MGPPRGPSNKSSSSKGKTGKSKSGSSASAPSSRVSKNKAKLPPPKQQKTRSTDTGPKKKKQRVYTAEELGVPTSNMITPAGVEKPKGKKKGKVFVDDQESMLTILAMVNADKEGQIESKMMRARQMEEIREARKKEAEAREQQRKDKLESTKDSIRRKRRRRDAEESTHQDAAPSKEKHSSRKRVSFA